MLKKAKKAQLLERLNKLKEVSGVDLKRTEALLDEMKKPEYEEREFDKRMNELFDEQYYEQEDSQVEELQSMRTMINSARRHPKVL